MEIAVEEKEKKTSILARLQGERREKWSCLEKWRLRRGRRKRKKGTHFGTGCQSPEAKYVSFWLRFSATEAYASFWHRFFINRSITPFLASGVL